MRIVVVFVLLLAVSGCDWLAEDLEVLTAEKLNTLKCEGQDPKETRWFYAGSADGYHRLVHRNVSGDKHYQIKESEFKVANPKHVSSNEANWLVMPWGPSSEECQE